MVQLYKTHWIDYRIYTCTLSSEGYAYRCSVSPKIKKKSVEPLFVNIRVTNTNLMQV